MRSKFKGRATEDDFNQVFELTKRGFKPRQIQEILGWNKGTVRAWLNFGSWKSYCLYKEIHNEKLHADKYTPKGQEPVNCQGLKPKQTQRSQWCESLIAWN